MVARAFGGLLRCGLRDCMLSVMAWLSILAHPAAQIFAPGRADAKIAGILEIAGESLGGRRRTPWMTFCTEDVLHEQGRVCVLFTRWVRVCMGVPARYHKHAARIQIPDRQMHLHMQ